MQVTITEEDGLNIVIEESMALSDLVLRTSKEGFYVYLECIMSQLGRSHFPEDVSHIVEINEAELTIDHDLMDPCDNEMVYFKAKILSVEAVLFDENTD